MGVIITTLPSAGEAFSRSAATRPPAPARFSITMLSLRSSFIFSASTRETMSMEPPGGKPTSTLRVLSLCAWAVGSKPAAARAVKSRRFMGVISFRISSE